MAEVWQTVTTWEGGGQLWQNVLFFRLEETGDLTVKEYGENLINGLISDIYPPWLDCVSTTVNISSTKVQRITGEGGPSMTKVWAPTDQPGTRAGSIGNTSENVCLEFPVHLNDKNVTGKVFISGILDDDVIDNVISDDVKTRVDALGTTLVQEYSLPSGGGHYQYVIFNRPTGFFKAPEFGQISGVVGSQRRRLRP